MKRKIMLVSIESSDVRGYDRQEGNPCMRRAADCVDVKTGK